uniref:Transmembrane protein 186 n=1 Tax=Polytomella parva TaxID=51329 RepID=A0A7S0UVN4_9CHLO
MLLKSFNYGFKYGPHRLSHALSTIKAGPTTAQTPNKNGNGSNVDNSILNITKDLKLPILNFLFHNAALGHLNASGPIRGFSSTSKGIRIFDDLTLTLPSSPFKKKKKMPDVPKLVLYRGKGIIFFRFFVRAKVFQLLGVAAFCVMISAFLSTQSPSTGEVLATGALLFGCIASSYCIWYYSGRYVGELSLILPKKDTVRFSVLDFWGNREDNDYPITQIIPPWRNVSIAEVKRSCRQPLTPITVTDDRQYYLSLSHGKLLEPVVFQNLLYGKPLDEKYSPQKFKEKLGDAIDAQEMAAGSDAAVAQKVIKMIIESEVAKGADLPANNPPMSPSNQAASNSSAADVDATKPIGPDGKSL